MENNNNIDKLFQDAASKTSFEFQEAYWTEFEKMLPAKKKGFPFFWLFSGILILGTCVGTYYFVDNNETIHANENDTLQKYSNEIETEENERNNSSQIINETSSSNNTSEHSSNTNEIITNSHNKTTKSFESKINPNGLNKNTRTTNVNTSSLNEIGNRTSGIDLKTEQYILNTSLKDPLALTPVASELNFIGKIDFPANPFGLFGLESPDLQLQNYSYSTRSKWNLYMDLGMGLGQSPIQDNTFGSNLTKSLNFGIGITYKPSNWIFSAGFDLNTTQFNNLLIRERVKVYGFGVTNFENELVYKSIYQLNLPIQIAYQKNNHMFTVTLNPSYLVSTKMEYQSVSNNEVIVENTMYGYRKGLKSWTFRPTVGYQHIIAPQWIIGTNISINSKSFIVPEIFEGNQNSFSLNGQFFIRKTFKL
jgi:hypothetical protein